MSRSALFIAALLVLAAPALADGFIVVPRHPPDRPQVRTIPLAVKYHNVKVTIEGQVATTQIDQVFINPNPYQLEGTYIFPLPETASISAFSMFIDGKEMPGELLEKDKARKIYTDIVRSMQDPALLEYIGRDMFKASIFPIPARGEKRVKLSYSEILRADGGLVRYRYPLNTEKFSSRPLERVSVVVDIKGKLPIKNVTCPTHPVEVVKKGENEVRVAYEDRNVTPDEDLLLYYALSDREFSMNFLTHREEGEEGYFMVLLSPSDETGKVIDKDVCFVMDTSGSMQGKKIEQARAALRFCIGALNPGDRFSMVPFATDARSFSETLLAASQENVAKALKFVDGIQAMGGTAIHEALTKALELSPNSNRPYMIVFVTDGLPTIGETQEPVILTHVKRMNKGNVRLFAFGVGNDVNTHLLDSLAEQNRGSRDYVSETEDLEIKISNFYTKVSHPVLSDIELSFPGAKVHDVYPRQLPDLFKGSQLVVVGRYDCTGASAAKLVGRVGGETKPIAHDVTFAEVAEENTFLPRLWAIRKIGFLLDEIRLHGEKKELKDEVVRLARLHGVVTPYTSFLVLEDQARARRGFTTTTGTRALDEDGTWTAGGGSGAGGSEGRGGSGGGGGRYAGTPRPASGPAADSGGGEGADAPAAEEPEAVFERNREEAKKARNGLRRATGKTSVDASKSAAALKGTLSGDTALSLVPDAGLKVSKGLMKLIEGIAFYRRGSIWVQTDLPKKPDRQTVKLFSEAYFELVEKLKKDKKAMQFLALGQVDFKHKGVVYSVR